MNNDLYTYFSKQMRMGSPCDNRNKHRDFNMIKFDVLNRFSDDVQFTAEIDCKETELHGIKIGLAVRWAIKNGANREGANLYGARLDGASGINDYIKCIQIETYPITYTSDVLQIGCERHLISEWAEFDNARIVQMDGKNALRFWKKYKDWIFQTIDLSPAKPNCTKGDTK